MPNPPKLLDHVREKPRLKHYGISTEQVYVDWIRRHIPFHDKQRPKNLGARDGEAFLAHLTVARGVTSLRDHL